MNGDTSPAVIVVSPESLRAIVVSAVAEAVGGALKAKPEPKLLRRKELAERLQITVREIARGVTEGRIPAPIRFGDRSPRWRSDQLDDWLQRGCPPCGPQKIRA